MLRSIRDLLDCCVDTQDGSLGKVRDLFFDDETWEIKFVVAGEPAGTRHEEIMIPLPAIRETNWDDRVIVLPGSFEKMIKHRLGPVYRPGQSA